MLIGEPASAEELIDVVGHGALGHVYVDGTWLQTCNCCRFTDNQRQGLRAASDFYHSPLSFRFQALVERWSMEDLIYRLRRLKCPA